MGTACNQVNSDFYISDHSESTSRIDQDVIEAPGLEEVCLASVSDRRVTRTSVEGLRTSAPAMIQIQTQDILRQHSDRIAVACIADLFAISEVDLPAALAEDIKNFVKKTSRDLIDFPNQEAKMVFLAELAEVPASQVPKSLREVVLPLGDGASPEVAGAVAELKAHWDTSAPEPVSLPRPQPKAATAAAVPIGGATRVMAASATPKAAPAAKTPRAKSATTRTPKAPADPARVESIRLDVLDRLRTREYAERGLKETVLIAGCRHRSTYKDLTEEEVRAELRRLEREGKVRHASDRWVIK